MKETKTPKAPKTCRACRLCANYGHGCQRPITEAEYLAWNVDYHVPPDCFEYERPD